jgi:predicted RNA-binding protein YlxR (DUF448 family)
MPPAPAGAGSAPERTCITCRAPAPKPDLIRISRDPDGGALRIGAGPGRGAYVHPHVSCVERALRPPVLARALRAEVSRDEVGRLRERIRQEMGSA